MMAKTRFEKINRGQFVYCPTCDRRAMITGHDKNAWNLEEETGHMIQRYYVSCPCQKKVLEQKQTLAPVTGKGAEAGRMTLTVETRQIDLPIEV